MSLRNVKIIATLGPSSSSREVIETLATTGVDVFRLNMSHGSSNDITDVHARIRAVEAQLGRPIAILGDLQGPKLRCGTFEQGSVLLKVGQKFRLDLGDEPGTDRRVTLPHPEVFAALQPGMDLLINDGLLRLRAVGTGEDFAECEVLVGGKISNKKGVNLPGALLPISPLSSKDRADLELLCQLGVDWIALSFVQRAIDVHEARGLIGGRARLVSKIEKPVAIANFQEILDASDGIMIARGDLGVEMPLQELPPLQRRLIQKCREHGKPVIVATQMLESMVHSPVPTRAEVSDVATAVYEGADAIMLSAETAAGTYPVEAVQTMAAVADEVEADASYRPGLSTKGSSIGSNPLAVAAREIAFTGRICAICCFTKTGATALGQAKERPQVPIIAMTSSIETARQLNLVWGVFPKVAHQISDFRQAVAAAIKCVGALGLVTPASLIAVTAGTPIHHSGTTNILRLASLDGSDMDQFD